MNFSFLLALVALGANAAFRLMNQARVPNDYLFATLLPEVNKPDYVVDASSMTIRTIMAGLSGMSSPYAPGGFIEVSNFLAKSAKITNIVELQEEQQRELQAILSRLGTQDLITQRLTTEALNFYNKVIVQAHFDTFEWLRAQSLIEGAINWTFNKLELKVDYNVPATHKFATAAGNDAYDGSQSKFWRDHYAALKLLRYNLRAIISNTTTITKIINQDANKFEVMQSGNVFTLKRYRTRGNGEVISGDSRDSLQLVAYDLEGEVFDPTDTTKTKKIPFVKDGKLLYVGNNKRSGYRVGEGSTPDPVLDAALGYTHIAPTVEGGGALGRWGRLRVPDDRDWSLEGKGVTNGLPVREDVTATEAKTVTLTTELS